MARRSACRLATRLRAQIRSLIELIQPASDAEQAQWLDALAWVDSGAPLFRTARPATPPKHLVAYFPLVDGDHILLVDHKNAKLWLPPGGHVEPGEDPRTTVARELREELGLEISPSEVEEPVLVSVTQTTGQTARHVDVSLWFPIHASRASPLRIDGTEFSQVRWLHRSDAVSLDGDPNLRGFLSKMHTGSYHGAQLHRRPTIPCSESS